MSEELEKQAQEKLAEARRLIREAGELAKQGQFALHFGAIGDFIPRSFVDRDLLRERAIETIKREGRYNGWEYANDPGQPDGRVPADLPRTPWDELSEDERESAIDDEIEALRDGMEVPYEFREYYDVSDTDRWWHPSRC
jgi:hypothetical protein